MSVSASRKLLIAGLAATTAVSGAGLIAMYHTRRKSLHRWQREMGHLDGSSDDGESNPETDDDSDNDSEDLMVMGARLLRDDGVLEYDTPSDSGESQEESQTAPEAAGGPKRAHGEISTDDEPKGPVSSRLRPRPSNLVQTPPPPKKKLKRGPDPAALALSRQQTTDLCKAVYDMGSTILNCIAALSYDLNAGHGMAQSIRTLSATIGRMTMHRRGVEDTDRLTAAIRGMGDRVARAITGLADSEEASRFEDLVIAARDGMERIVRGREERAGVFMGKVNMHPGGILRMPGAPKANVGPVPRRAVSQRVIQADN